MTSTKSIVTKTNIVNRFAKKKGQSRTQARVPIKKTVLSMWTSAIKKDWFFVLVLLLATRLFLFGVGDIAHTWMAQNPEDTFPKTAVSDSKYIDIWYRFDAGTYYRIVQYGYDNPDIPPYAYYPHFPAMAWAFWLVTRLTGLMPLMGIIFSNACLYGALLLFLRIVQGRFGEGIARKSVLFALIAPGTFFFSILYTESFFLLFLMAGIYALERGRFWVAGLCGLVLSLTRIVGVVFVVGAGIYYLMHHRKEFLSLNWAGLLLVPLGLGGYIVYLGVHTGDPLIFAHLQEDYGRNIHVGSSAYLAQVLSFFDGSLGNTLYLGFVLLTILAVVWCWIEWEKGYAAFAAIVVALPVLTASLAAIYRYTLIAFPIYVFLAWLSEKDETLGWLLMTGCVMLMSLLTALYVNWYWIT